MGIFKKSPKVDCFGRTLLRRATWLSAWLHSYKTGRVISAEGIALTGNMDYKNKEVYYKYSCENLPRVLCLWTSPYQRGLVELLSLVLHES